MTPKDKIKEKITIYDTVSHYIRLEKSGNQWKARCPFHNEKTPSFYVSPQRESYHCFGCGKHGDIFTFVMEIEKIEFIDALKVLANRAGVSLSEFNKEENDNLYEILTEAKNYFVNNLKKESNIIPKRYLLDRGIDSQTLDDYNIGFADNEWTGLFDHLIKRGFKKENIIESGVCFVSEKSGKVLDKWRGRIMFPICGQSDQILGFTGRILPTFDDGKQGKYVNSPETRVFKKNQILFNYNKAKNYISEHREVILVEGQMDAIMAYQAGIKNVVAVSGTAFTDAHINILKRLADNIVLCFDNDDAGKSARNRTALLCALASFEIYNLNISDLNKNKNTDYKDIADIVKDDKNNLYELMNNKKYFVETLCDEARDLQDKQKIDFVKSHILPFVKSYNSPLIQNHYLKIVSSILDYDIDMLIQEVKVATRDVFVPDVNKKDILKIKSYSHDDIIVEIVALYGFLKRQNTNLDKDIEELIVNKIGDFEFYNLEIFKENLNSIPEEEINKKFIALEHISSLTLKYFFDLINIIIKEKIKEEEQRLLNIVIQKDITIEDKNLILQKLNKLKLVKK